MPTDPDYSPEQDVVLDVFTRGYLTCAHTANAIHPGEWWHLWTAAGRYLGSTNRPELLGALIQQTR